MPGDGRGYSQVLHSSDLPAFTFCQHLLFGEHGYSSFRKWIFGLWLNQLGREDKQENLF